MSKIRSGYIYSLWKRLRSKAGASFCKEWREDFLKFKLDMEGLPKVGRGYMLKPIKESLGYCLGNVRWVPFNFRDGRGADGNLHTSKGQIFGDWAVEEDSLGLGNKEKVLCRCLCGTERKVAIGNLVAGKTIGCGCSRKKGKYGTRRYSREYNTWETMIRRCTRPHTVSYNTYGAKGVTVCDRWRESFENFVEDMGERPEGMTLDRIDPFGNYCPENCKWSTIREQSINKRGAPDLPYSKPVGDKFVADYREKGAYNFVGKFDTKEAAFIAAIKHMQSNGITPPEVLMAKYDLLTKSNPTKL